MANQTDERAQDVDDEGETKEATLKITYNGVTQPVEFEAQELVKTILERAIRVFNVTQQPHLLSLFRVDGTTVPDASTAAAAGLKRGTKLFLRPDQVKGGC